MIKKKRIGMKGCIFIFLICLSFFLFLEVSVRLILAGHDVENNYAVCRGFSNQYRHWLPAGKDDSGTVRYRTAPSFLKAIPSPVYNQTFLDPKPARTFRVFVFGGSSAAGAIFSDRGNISDQLRLRLSDILPERRVEVINAAVEGYGTNRVLKMVREAAAYQPDLFVVYSGHNDLGERAFRRKIFGSDAQYEFHRFFEHSMAFTLFRSGILRIKPYLWRNPSGLGRKKDFQRERKEALAQIEQFGGDFTGEYQRTLNQFQANYKRIINIANSGDVPLIIMTVVPNLWDWEPESVELPFNPAQVDSLKTELYQVLKREQWDQAGILVDRIIELDERDARIFFIKAGLEARHQRWDEARRYLRKAAKWDASIVMPRTTEDFNGTIRDLARRYPDVLFLDIEAIVEDAAPRSLIDTRWIFDSCHPQLETYELIANYIVKSMSVNRIPSENNIARLTNQRTNEEYRSILGLNNVVLAEKERFMAMQTLRLVYPRNTFVAWRCLENVLLVEPHHPAIRSVMATLLALVENNIIDWTVSASFPGNRRDLEGAGPTMSTLMTSVDPKDDKTLKTAGSGRDRQNSTDYLVGIGIAEIAARRMLSWDRESLPCGPHIFDTMLTTWRDISTKPDFLQYWTRLFHRNLNGKLSLLSPITGAFLGEGWAGFGDWPINSFPRPLSPTGSQAEFFIPLENATSARLVLELLPDTEKTSPHYAPEALEQLQLALPAVSPRPLGFFRLDRENQSNSSIRLISQEFLFPKGITAVVISRSSHEYTLPQFKRILFVSSR